jgi:unsaturated rhamnogalacturonyl hydrolase
MNKQEIMEKIEAVVERLMTLGEADNEKDKTTSEDEHKKGLIERDFGIKEWDWPQGVGLFGLIKLQEYFDDKRYDSFLNQWYLDNIVIGLPSQNINTTAPFLTLTELAKRIGDQGFDELCVQRAEWLMEHLPKTKEGGFQHVTSAIGDRMGVRLNEGELWIDTLFMAVLFLNKMGHKHNRKEWRDEALKQVLIHIKYLYDKKTGLFYHGWSFLRNDNFGEIYWGRGNAWFTFGIIEYLQVSKDTLPQAIVTYIQDTYLAQVDQLIKLQDASSGLWHTVLDDPTSYLEVSGSAGIAAGILQGIRCGYLDISYQEHALKAIEGIANAVDETGTLTGVSAGTGIGMDAQHYKDIIIAPMAYGQSLGLLALTESLYFL